jgi:hypothetical protein
MLYAYRLDCMSFGIPRDRETVARATDGTPKRPHTLYTSNG